MKNIKIFIFLFTFVISACGGQFIPVDGIGGLDTDGKIEARFKPAALSAIGDESSTLEATSLESETSLEIQILGCEHHKDEGAECALARFTNKGSKAINQVFFPDIRNLPPVAGAPAEQTEIRMGLGVVNPFAIPEFDQEYSGGMYQKYGLRWVDYGNFAQGLSIFERTWGEEAQHQGSIFPRPTLKVVRGSDGVRLVWRHHVRILPGQSYTTAPFIFKHHTGGWARGIEVYRRFAQQMIAGSHWLDPSPSSRVPHHIKESAAFQTVWMVESTEPRCGARVNFTSAPRKSGASLVDVAREARTAGISEVVLIGAVDYGSLPIGHDSRVGSRSELIEAISKSRNSGKPVNFSMFFNVQGARCFGEICQGAEPFPVAPETNCKMPEKWWLNAGVLPWAYNPHSVSNYWNYHSAKIPNTELFFSKVGGQIFDPYLSSHTKQDPEGEYYPQPGNIRRALEMWRNDGAASWMMDVFVDTFRGETQRERFTSQLVSEMSLFRLQTRQSLANSKMVTFAGEPDVMNLERTAGVLDYMWGWLDYIEAGPYLNAVKYPRINTNVGKNTKIAKLAFLDGLFINAMPRAPQKANGSALLSSEPELARTIQTLSALRRQFIAYFGEGDFIGESILTEPVTPLIRRSAVNIIGGANANLGPLEVPEIAVRAHHHEPSKSLVLLT